MLKGEANTLGESYTLWVVGVEQFSKVLDNKYLSEELVRDKVVLLASLWTFAI